MKPWVVVVCVLWGLLLAGEAAARGVGTASLATSRGVTAGEAVIALATRGNHTCLLTGDGLVRCWGFNGFGQLGNGTTTNQQTPVPVSRLTHAVALATGINHTCALEADGSAVCWGSNFAGQLGDGTKTNRSTPVPVSGLTDAVALAAGLGHTCALRADGTVACWGFNGSGQLGDGTTANRSAPVVVSGLTHAVALAAGEHHTCALRADGVSFCWGSNTIGQLGNGTTMSQTLPGVVSELTHVVGLAAGTFHTCALVAGGQVHCWGENGVGQLGDGRTDDRATPGLAISGLGPAVVLATGAFHTCAVRANGLVRCWGANAFGQLGNGLTTAQPTTMPVAVGGLTDAVAVAAGFNHTCALVADGRVLCWGSNFLGQLGDGTVLDSATPIPVAGVSGSISARHLVAGNEHTCALRADGHGACWGANPFGQLGEGSTMSSTIPEAISGLTNVVALTAGSGHTCALRADGSVTCWGSNGSGELGNGMITSQPTALPGAVSGLTNVVALAAGIFHTCALGADGRVHCWGGNFSGQLGAGTTPQVAPMPVPVSGLTQAVAVAAGAHHTCALGADGLARCWGSNSNGQLGDGTTLNQPTPVLVKVLTHAVALTAGSFHTCALRADGRVLCWGSNFAGELGDGTTMPRLLPVAVSGFANAVALGAGELHTCALRADGVPWCWGGNNTGELGNGTTAQQLTPEMVVRLTHVVALAAGANHTCALRADGVPFCWGNNLGGQLGEGTTTDRLAPVEVPSFRFNIDPAVELRHPGRQATVTALVACPEGQQVKLHIALTQGEAVGKGTAAEACTGQLARYPVRVQAHGPTGFASGPATAAAVASIRVHGQVVDLQEWTRRVELASE